MSRVTVTVAFLLVAGLIIWSAFWVGTGTGRGNLLINLGTEIVGIVLTVAVVDFFFERRRLQSKARQLAWTALHAIEHAVWVWQGGPRQLETDELLGLLSAVGPKDPLPEFTQNLLLHVGTRSKQLLHNEPSTLKMMPGLREALEELTSLSAIREGGSLTPPRRISEILKAGVTGLAEALGRPTERHLAGLIRHRDPSLEGQEERHFGVSAESGRRPSRRDSAEPL